MGLICLTCPSCGGEIQLDDLRSFGFCLYCGQKIILEEAIERTVIIDQTANIENLLKRANDFYRRNQGKKALEYIDKVLDIDIDNKDAAKLRDIVVKELSLEAFISDCFMISGCGAGITCTIKSGTIKQEDLIDLYDTNNDFIGTFHVAKIEMNKKLVPSAGKGNTVSLLLKEGTKQILKKAKRIFNPLEPIVSSKKREPKPWD